jgi:hypothetical protein
MVRGKVHRASNAHHPPRSRSRAPNASTMRPRRARHPSACAHPPRGASGAKRTPAIASERSHVDLRLGERRLLECRYGASADAISTTANRATARWGAALDRAGRAFRSRWEFATLSFVTDSIGDRGIGGTPVGDPSAGGAEGPDPAIGAGITLLGIFLMGMGGARDAHYVFDVGMVTGVVGAGLFVLFVTLSAMKGRRPPKPPEAPHPQT